MAKCGGKAVCLTQFRGTSEGANNEGACLGSSSVSIRSSHKLTKLVPWGARAGGPVKEQYKMQIRRALLV